MELVFNANGNQKQLEAFEYWLDNTTESICYGGSKGSGKSFLGVSIIFGDAFIYPNTHYFIARKKLNDLRKFTVPSIYEVFEKWQMPPKMYKFDANDNYFKLLNGSKVFLIEAKYMPSDPKFTRFGSMQMTRGMIEEAGEFEQEARNNLSASVGRWKNKEYKLMGKLIETCNPSKNYLYPMYYLAHKNGTIPNRLKFVQALPSDNKMLPEGYLERLKNELSPEEAQRLLYGNWEYDDDPRALIRYESILDIFTNSHVNRQGSYITADIARLGNDKTVIMVWQGFDVVEICAIDKSELDEVYYKINDLKKRYAVPTSNIIVDADGLGSGVRDFLKCKEFHGGARSVGTDNYKSLKSQCYFELAKYINQGMIGISAKVTSQQRDFIIKELEQVKCKSLNPDMKHEVISKEEMKEGLQGRSPDYADSLMMRFAFTFAKKISAAAASY